MQNGKYTVPDQLTEDQLVSMFEDLRTNELRQVRPPGTVTARHTVRRRRATTRLAAGMAVAVIAVSVATTGLQTDDGWLAGLSQSDAVRRAREQVQPPADIAAALVDRFVADEAFAQSSGPLTTEVIKVVEAPAGRYELIVACTARGEVNVDLLQPPPSAGEAAPASVTMLMGVCDSAPTLAGGDLVVPAASVMSIRIRRDAVESGPAGFAYKLVARPAEAEEQLVSEESGQNAKIAEAKLDRVMEYPVRSFTTLYDTSSSDERPRQAGDYIVGLICVGPGDLTIQIGTGSFYAAGGFKTDEPPIRATRRITCTRTGKVDKVRLTLSAEGGFSVAAGADSDARNRAAWAYAIDPV
jgi:hypothetical protein